jgi:hypothetical protein
MSGLSGIPVAVETIIGEELSGNVIALLHEVATLQAHFLDKGEIGQIDLRTLPLSEGEFKALDSALGHGEVSCHIDAAGKSEITETLLPGVWRIRHYNINDDLIAELIEVSDIPEILKAGVKEMEEGMNTLKAQLTEMAENINLVGE